MGYECNTLMLTFFCVGTMFMTFTHNTIHCTHHHIQTALHLATHLQQTEMIRKLLIAGASLNITDHKGNTPLHIAARFSSTKSLEEIIRYMSVQTILQVAAIKNNQGMTCIHIAARQGNMDVLRKFKSLGVDMNMQVREREREREMLNFPNDESKFAFRWLKWPLQKTVYSLPVGFLTTHSGQEFIRLAPFNL